MEAVERSCRRTGPSAGALAAQAQEVVHVFGLGHEHPHEEGVRHGEQAEQLEPVVPTAHAHTLSAQIALAEAEGALDGLMRIALYARISTSRQVHAQTITVVKA